MVNSQDSLWASGQNKRITKELVRRIRERRDLLRQAIHEAMTSGAAPHIVRTCIAECIGTTPISVFSDEHIDALDTALRLKVQFDRVPTAVIEGLQRRVGRVFSSVS